MKEDESEDMAGGKYIDSSESFHCKEVLERMRLISTSPWLTFIRIVIPNLFDGISYNLLVVNVSSGCDLATEEDHASLAHGLYSDSRVPLDMGQTGLGSRNFLTDI